MVKYKDCKVLLDFAAFMGREVAKGKPEQEALAELRGAIIMFVMIGGLSSSMCDNIFNLVFDQYQKSFIAYFEGKEEDEQE